MLTTLCAELIKDLDFKKCSTCIALLKMRILMSGIILLRGVCPISFKKYVGQCDFDLGKLRFNLKYENDEC
ncbi:hypothetical protein AGMMS5026_06310 [Endomicrobiia bacterium]|nr:hypothetical protein AGMMS49571_07580 [Endomicrobiia bacterium]GHT18963.1 hypothetical protein AGMMS49929_01670 [Endomicrobiia bacterium]GHT28255.1 hypothetical protein AGMMS49995_08740 [Endomicrobiia bacterium]GHT30914.1 hypothetical protein AGMMS5026_06310 [Endomicrobiia bacterium]